MGMCVVCLCHGFVSVCLCVRACIGIRAALRILRIPAVMVVVVVTRFPCMPCLPLWRRRTLYILVIRSRSRSFHYKITIALCWSIAAARKAYDCRCFYPPLSPYGTSWMDLIVYIQRQCEESGLRTAVLFSQSTRVGTTLPRRWDNAAARHCSCCAILRCPSTRSLKLCARWFFPANKTTVKHS